MDRLLDFPLGLSATLLFTIAMARGQATYWLARSVTGEVVRRTAPEDGWRASVHRWLSGEAVARGRGAVQRFGVVVVPLCYITVGLQTVVLAAAGCLRLRWSTFTLAQIPGAMAWAAIYTTIGFAVWGAAIAAIAGNPAILAALAVVAAAAVLLIGRTRNAAPAREHVEVAPGR